jgi:hypothetical protein
MPEAQARHRTSMASESPTGSLATGGELVASPAPVDINAIPAAKAKVV